MSNLLDEGLLSARTADSPRAIHEAIMRSNRDALQLSLCSSAVTRGRFRIPLAPQNRYWAAGRLTTLGGPSFASPRRVLG